ncbi:hypothetical protein ACXHMN_11160 [Rhizobium sp. LEGMi12c]
MTSIASSFRKAVNGLKPPSSAHYSQSDWDLAYQNVAPSDEDTNLYLAAKWIAEEYAKARELFASPYFGPLDAEWATVLAIASLNREYRTARQLHEDMLSGMEKSPLVSADAISGLRIRGPAGQHFTLEDITESATDYTENWLFDAFNAVGTSQPPDELTKFAIPAAQAYSFRKGMNTLWNQTWHEGLYCELSEDGSAAWMPADRRAAILNQTWLQRQQNNLLNYPAIDYSVWPRLPLTRRKKLGRQRAVTSVKRVGKSLRLRVSCPSYLSRKPPIYVIEKSAIEGTYLADFFEAELPNTKGVTAAVLLLAWHLIVDIAVELTRNITLPRFLAPEDAKALALAVPAASLIQVMRDGLLVDEDTARAIIDFLTFQLKSGKNQKGNRGLWSAPLVKVPNCDEYLLPLPALHTSNVIRKVEAWLEKGGIDDTNPVAARGEKYEVLYRTALSELIRKNRKFTTASVAEHGVKKTREFDEQIDLLVVFGGLCLVGEIKLFLMPADSNERARYDNKLESAALQAKRKLESLVKRPEIVAASLGITTTAAERLKYIPLVVTAQDYGFSTRVNDVLIVEGGFLKMFLSGNNIVVGRAIQKGSSRTTDQTIEYYKNEAQAAQRFESEVLSPYVLRRISERFSWGKTPYPTLAHPSATIAVPIFNDLSGEERRIAQSMIATLSNRRTES